MKVKTSIVIKGGPVVFSLDTTRLDRNYSDENYAYWIEQDKFGFFHEVNINKTDDGEFKSTGIVNTWFDLGRFEDATDPDCVSDVTFVFYDDKPAVPKLDSLISKQAYDNIKDCLKCAIGNEAAERLFPAVVRTLEEGDGKVREQILIDWLNVDCLRVCTQCGAIMEKGWYLNCAGYACSDECAAKSEGITMEQFKKWRIYKDDIVEYLEQFEDGRNIDELTQEECDIIIADYCKDCDYYWTEWS